jgi:drug/metabolite transporter (DMT)-like permease
MLAFAGNSILCRLGLGPDAIDPASFAALRLSSGALLLVLLAARSSKSQLFRLPRPWPALFLFAYAIPFSFAYQSLTTGTGALLLFGCVQITMLLAALARGERPTLTQWFGLSLALGGLGYLLAPGASAPAPLGAALMCVAGISWGLYSLVGRGSRDPLQDTARNFLLATPLSLLVMAGSQAAGAVHFSARGVLWAVSSGAVASGLGYAVWYAALRRLRRTQAASIQLSVPVLAALGGLVFLDEVMTPRLIVSTGVVLLGIGLTLRAKGTSSSR